MIDEVMMLRHGRTQYNLEHRLQGQIDVPLDIVGQWQVDQTGFALASRYYWAKVNRLASHPEAIAQPGPDAAERTDIHQYEEAPAAGRRMVVLTSDLFRAQQTAHAFADVLGLPVVCDRRLRERSFGEWEGLTRAEIKAVPLRTTPPGSTTLAGKPNTGWKVAPKSASAEPTQCAHWSVIRLMRMTRPPRLCWSLMAHGLPPPLPICLIWTLTV